MKKIGRPKGSKFGEHLHQRIDSETAAELAALAEFWRCSNAEAVRRAIQETAKRALK